MLDSDWMFSGQVPAAGHAGVLHKPGQAAAQDRPVPADQVSKQSYETGQQRDHLDFCVCYREYPCVITSRVLLLKVLDPPQPLLYYYNC